MTLVYKPEFQGATIGYGKTCVWWRGVDMTDGAALFDTDHAVELPGIISLGIAVLSVSGTPDGAIVRTYTDLWDEAANGGAGGFVTSAIASQPTVTAPGSDFMTPTERIPHMTHIRPYLQTENTGAYVADICFIITPMFGASIHR